MEHVEAASCRNDSMAGQMPLAISYVPMQKFVNVANAADGLKMGTIFEDLYLNFYCTECRTCRCGTNRNMRRPDYSSGGYMPGNQCRNTRNYNNNYGGGNNGCNVNCNHNYNSGCSNTPNSNCNGNSNMDCGNGHNTCPNMGCGSNRNNKRFNSRMNNCNC